MTRKDENFPKYETLLEATFKALVELGRSGYNEEILETVIRDCGLTNDIVDRLPDNKANKQPNNGFQKTELECKLAWARSDLKKYGAINNISRGQWSITPEFATQKEIDAEKVLDFIRKRTPKSNQGILMSVREQQNINDPDEAERPWRARLAKILHEMNPYAFEQFTKHLLRQCGFSQVEVTPKSNDGGVDGFGKFPINEIFCLKVAFQCKRYANNKVSVENIRDFRGALSADIEKGLFITTGRFTQDAKEEASKAGKQQIDLIDGEKLIAMLEEKNIGVRTIYEVDEEFFKAFPDKA